MRLKHLEEQEWLKLAQDAEWSVSKLAKLCKVSVRGLELRFHKQMDRTPKEWLVEQRQKQAAKLLRDGSSVKETAGKIGYKYSNHFSREFKNHWGHCPTKIGPKNRKLRLLA